VLVRGRVFNFKEAVENGLDEDGVLIFKGKEWS
jgi:hypothetical protein